MDPTPEGCPISKFVSTLEQSIVSKAPVLISEILVGKEYTLCLMLFEVCSNHSMEP